MRSLIKATIIAIAIVSLAVGVQYCEKRVAHHYKWNCVECHAMGIDL